MRQPGALSMLFCIGALCASPGSARAAADAAASAAANTMLELAFASDKTYTDPFNDVELDVLVTGPDGAIAQVPAFWAGGNTWKVRYASTSRSLTVHNLERQLPYVARHFDPVSGRLDAIGPAAPDAQGDFVVAPPAGTDADWVLVLRVDDRAARRPPISIHPENSKYFLFRGQPLVLLTATEHYGSVVNRAFDFERYLADAADKRQTFTRTFLLFREQQSSRNPFSPLKAESPDYLAPYPRTGPGQAMDGEPKYDLDAWNGEFFARLHKFLDRASELGIVVELTLFSNTYADGVWALNPSRAANNVQKVGQVEWPDYTSLKDPELNKRQFAYAAKIVEETSDYDNVYYEICNEPGGGVAGRATPADVDAWQAEIGRVVRETLARQKRKHLVFGTQAFDYARQVTQPLDAAFSGSLVDAVNVHPLPNVVLGDRTYMMGRFMSKDLVLADFAAFCRATQRLGKPCVLDEDNAATLYRDTTGWTIHRKRAWIALVSQTHYDMIDFSITTGSEAGTRESSAQLRTWMKHLSTFMHDFDFLHAKPVADFFRRMPEHVVSATLAARGGRWIAYLADDREVTDATAGEPIAGSIVFRLPEGNYRASLYSPTTGLYSPAVAVRGGSEPVTLDVPEFRHDVVLDIRRR